MNGGNSYESYGYERWRWLAQRKIFFLGGGGGGGGNRNQYGRFTNTVAGRSLVIQCRTVGGVEAWCAVGGGVVLVGV